jgi:glycosyltransferase involved in cell wall biosynthesis
LNTTVSSPERLRILSVLNLDWNRHLGAARVYIELNEQWRAAGHAVEHYSFSEAFPTRHRSARDFVLRRLAFPHRAAAFVRTNAGQFDVVDALAGSLSAPKSRLGFQGLLVARSVGSHRLYDDFERSVRSRWPRANHGTFAGRLFYSVLNGWLMNISDAAIERADLINVPNNEEAAFLRDQSGIKRPVMVQPYGLHSDNRRALISAARPVADRLKNRTISFIGMWAPRKGSRIWGEIVRRVSERIPDVRFSFLGTMTEPSAVRHDIGADFGGRIEVISEFSPDELPTLLSKCAVGAFPSYVEGFGLAVLEQLAAGIPTVAFDEGGPRDILQAALPELLVPTGNIESFANALARILESELSEYERLVRLSLETAQKYSWSKIAQDTIRQYRSTLTSR